MGSGKEGLSVPLVKAQREGFGAPGLIAELPSSTEFSNVKKGPFMVLWVLYFCCTEPRAFYSPASDLLVGLLG